MADTRSPELTEVERVTLAECPIGLFWSDHELCLKTEYGNNEGRIDAYIVSTGEFFWGVQPQTIVSQRAQLVTPIDTDRAFEALSSKNELPSEIAERVDARIAEHRAHLAEMHKQYGRGTVPDERCIGIVLNFGDLLDLRAALNPKDTDQ
jgi:hypothetical protein